MVRSACFASLDVLQAKWGPDIPWLALADGFSFFGKRVPFFNRAYGIYRAAGVQQGPAALSVNSSYNQSRYQDEETPEGILYRYQDGPIDNHFNRWLREAHALQVPLAYFVGTGPGWYRPEYPTFVERDIPESKTVLLTFGRMGGPMEEREPAHLDDPIERRYEFVQVKQRLHQAQFRRAVLPAYQQRCTICQLKELSLLDAAHIAPDASPTGDPVIANGLSMCSIHHRAFDQDLVGISPDYQVHISSRLLEDDDGPMLELLKGFHGHGISVPSRKAHQPDRERLAARFERFTGS
jgi:putative restriction endonuclease